MSAPNTAGEARASKCDGGCQTLAWMKITRHTDAAKRCADGVNLVIAARGTEVIGKWLCVKLADGSVDATVYDYQSDAVGAMWPRELEYAYLQVPRQWMTLCESESYLRSNRLRYDAGMNVMPDPRDVKRPGPVRDVIPPLTREANERTIRDFARSLGLRI